MSHEFGEHDVVTVYPDRRRVATVALVSGGVAAALGFGVNFLTAYPAQAQDETKDQLGYIAAIVFVLILAIIAVEALSQVIHPRPLLRIGQAGIALRGGGLIRWDEIITVSIQSTWTPNMWLTRRQLRLQVNDPAAVRDRQPAWLRLLLKWSILDASLPTTIYERLLPIPLEDIEDMIIPHLRKLGGDLAKLTTREQRRAIAQRRQRRTR